MLQNNNEYVDNIIKNIPDELKKYNSFVLWASVTDTETDKIIKRPVYVDENNLLKNAKSNDPTTWKDYKTVTSDLLNNLNKERTFKINEGTSTGLVTGIGFELKSEYGIVGIDMDHCIEGDISNATTTEELLNCISENRRHAVEKLINLHTYIEISPSRTGLHAYLMGKSENSQGKDFEIYTDRKFLTFTGNMIFGSEKKVTGGEESQNLIDELIKYNHSKKEKTDNAYQNISIPSSLRFNTRKV